MSRSASDEVEIAFAGIERQAAMVARGELSSRELVEIVLTRVERLDPQLRCFVSVFGEEALAAASVADATAPSERGPLHGVPVAIKDELDVAGRVTGMGSRAFAHAAAADAEIVARLRRAGAVIVGKTTLPELALWGHHTESLAQGVTRNPWDTSRATGGSSGGSAAAVAAGIVPVATASDAGGSIRLPAAHCGLFGLKPQAGRVPTAPRPWVFNGLSSDGCLTRSVADTGLYLDAVADRPRGVSYRQAAAGDPGRLRVAVSMRSTLRHIRPAPPVRDAVHGTAELLAGLGHELAEASPPFGAIYYRFAGRYFQSVVEDTAGAPHPELLEPRTRQFARMAKTMPPAWRRHSQRSIDADRRRMARFFEAHDVLMMPVMGAAPCAAGEWADRRLVPTLIAGDRFHSFTLPWNHTGQPAASVPCGFDGDGLPLAVQLVGRPDSEPLLLALAAQIERERPWAGARPALAEQ